MPVVNFSQYQKMIEAARKGQYAYPAINISSSSTANAAIEAFEAEGSDGIVQVSTGAGEFASGQGSKDAVVGAIALAHHIRRIADQKKVFIAIHTDHCPPKKVNNFLIPLIEETERLRAQGRPNLFNSHMFDGSELPLDENMKLATELHQRCHASEIILEVEAGVVGGEEDGVNNEGLPADKLYTTPHDMVEVARCLQKIGPFLFAATFGNVHGVYKPGNVQLKPSILKEGQQAVVKEFGEDALLNLVFHGGSGSSLEEIHETLRYGVVKMNIDTDTQYAYTRAVADFMLKNYDQVFKLDGEVGSKKHYDPRAWMKVAEKSMQERIQQACKDLKSSGRSIA